MAVTAKIESIDREIDLIISDVLSPAAQSQSQFFADFAQEQIDEARIANRQAMGGEVPYTVWVDGKRDAPLRTVKPNGEIHVEFELAMEGLGWIMTQLQKHSPVLTGRYASSHELFADGEHVYNFNDPPLAQEYVFVNLQPYARKIEGDEKRPPLSSQAPDGVYQVVATLAKQKFGNIAKVRFSYRTAVGGLILGGRAGDRHERRNPAIVVTLRSDA